jgi:hypothetical protein
MKRLTEAEYELIAPAAVERLGPEGVWLFGKLQTLAEERGWSLKEQVAHLEGVTDVVKGLIDGWVEPPVEGI